MKNLIPLKIISSLLMIVSIGCGDTQSKQLDSKESSAQNPSVIQDSNSNKKPEVIVPVEKPFDTLDYNNRLKALTNNDSSGKWPAKGAAYPLPGAMLPYNRIIAYYGNLYSKRMGILGELPKAEMVRKLLGEVEKWKQADSSLNTIPALHYIAVSAQASPGPAGKYRLRMPISQVDTILKWAREINALAFVDIQVGLSTLQDELPPLRESLKAPDMHLGIDPEFSMKTGVAPGKKIGTFSAEDINYAIDFLAGIVKENNLPPKVLVIHRFTQGMITNYQNIKRVPEVQVVIDMDGFGAKHLKKSTWTRYIYREPVQFTGFKLFYKNDNKPPADGMLTPKELLKYTPRPVYIQYQ